MVLKSIFSKRLLIVFLMGFSSGLPIALIGGTLQAWLTDAKIDLKIVTLFTLTGLPYTYKFLWAPSLDSVRLPFLGLRRGWLITIQSILIVSIVLLGASSPEISLTRVTYLALALAFFGASQDIVIDAYRTELLSEHERGPGASMAIMGYRIGMLVSGGLALILADHLTWFQVYATMALFMLIGVAVTIFAPEPTRPNLDRPNFWLVARNSFQEFFQRRGAYEILLFVLIYKVGDVMAVAPLTRFLMDIGFEKSAIGAVAKTFGLIFTIIGASIAGIYIPKLGLYRSLLIFGILQTVFIISFSALAMVGNNLGFMTLAISLENLCNGMGSAAYTAFLMSLCNKEFTATQYALLTSVMAVTRYLAGAATGYLAASLGWSMFFVVCLLSAVPGLFLLTRFRRWELPERT